MERTDEEIMIDYQAGDQDAMQTIFHRHKMPLLNFCLRILGNRADAEEIAGDVFLTLVTHKDTFKSQAKFSTWIYTIARNKCISHLRRRKFTWAFPSLSSPEESESPAIQIPSSDDLPHEALVRQETATHVRNAIDRLPYEQREAIVLKEYHDFSYEEISTILSCSLEKVKILIFRAKERLRIDLTSFLQEETR